MYVLFFLCVSGIHCFIHLHLHLRIVVAVIVGIIAGPLVTNGFNPYSWQDHDEITKQLTRCIIAIQVTYLIPIISFTFFINLFLFKGDGGWYRVTKVRIIKRK